MLEETIDAYNTRDKLTFANEVTQDVVNGVVSIVDDQVNALSDRLIQILKDLKVDSEKFKELGITFEEKAFYDVLTEVRDQHGFEYADERCIQLAKKIKTLIDDTEGYPPEWDQEVFEKVLQQVENYKHYAPKIPIVSTNEREAETVRLQYESDAGEMPSMAAESLHIN